MSDCLAALMAMSASSSPVICYFVQAGFLTAERLCCTGVAASLTCQPLIISWLHMTEDLPQGFLGKGVVLWCVQIVGIVGAILVAMGSKTDYATGFLDLVVYLMQQGCVAPVMSMMTNWAYGGSADPLLVQHFIFKTLAVCGPPYSSYFCSMMLR